MKATEKSDSTPYFDEKDKTAKYPPSCSEANQCPVCGSLDLEYESAEIMDDSVKYPWECTSCGHEGCEWGAINFDGHYVYYGPDGEVLTEVPNHPRGENA